MKRKSFLEFISIENCRIQVGLDAESNDNLSLKISQPNEWWMHWEGGAGAHVVICCCDDDIHSALPETLKDAATLAVRHSKALPKENTSYTVTLTRPYFLHKPKGAKAGMVQIATLARDKYSTRRNKKNSRQTRRLSHETPEEETIMERFCIRYNDARYERLASC